MRGNNRKLVNEAINANKCMASKVYRSIISINIYNINVELNNINEH